MLYSYYLNGKVVAKTDSSKGANAKAMKETVLLGRIHSNIHVTYITADKSTTTSYGYDSLSSETNYGQLTWDGEIVPGIDFLYGADAASGSATKVVRWTGNASGGYTLAISESGSYKLMESFKYADYNSDTRLTLDNIDVILDLNGKKITSHRKTDVVDKVAFVMIKIKNGSSLTVTCNGAIDLNGLYTCTCSMLQVRIL